jgi:predicted RNase H-like HicB family nuclease
VKVTARVQRAGDWWAVEVPAVPGVFTQTRRLDQIAEQVADAVATMLEDVDASQVEVEVDPVIGPEKRELLQEARRTAEQAAQAQARASVVMRRTIAELREHLSVRDVAALLGMSHQRVSQLARNVVPIHGARARGAFASYDGLAREVGATKAVGRKAPAKKTTVKRAPAQRTAAKKAPVKKTSAKKAVVKRAAAKKSVTKRTPAKRSRTNLIDRARRSK